MATVKIKFRKSTRENGAGTIVYQLYHDGKVRLLSSGMRIPERFWDAAREQPIEISENKDDCEMLHNCRVQLECDMVHFGQIIDDLNAGRKSYALEDVINAFHNSATKFTVLSFMKEQIESLEQSRRLGTAHNYKSTMKSFSDFLNHKDIPFSLMTSKLISDYEQWLFDRGVVRNSSSFYLRILRSVYNKAVKKGLAKQTNPFEDVYTGVDRTRKRAMDEKLIMGLLELDLKTEAQRQSRDLFIFSYCTRGMAFVDIAYLKKSDISGGVISYIRRKTGQQMSVKIEPCVQSIIDHYAEKTKGSPYMFPIITASDPKKAFNQYQSKLGYYNRQLKKLSKKLGAELPISSYWARHSWATSARDKNVPLSVISAGMGHTSEKTTQIYLASLDNSVIDKANSEILSPLKDLMLY